jgi:hypothetical protein
MLVSPAAACCAKASSWRTPRRAAERDAVVDLLDEALDPGGRADHLVGRGQVGIVGVAERGGQILAGDEQVSEHLHVFWDRRAGYRRGTFCGADRR